VVETADDRMDFAVPGFRSYDVIREVDLLEEVARTYGYDRFDDVLGAFLPTTVPDHPLFHLEDDLRDLLVGAGFLEAQTMAFAPEGEGEVEVSNPVSAQENVLRMDLLPGLVRRVEYNFARGQRDVRLFELGTVFSAGGEGELPREAARLAVVLTGERVPSHWSDQGTDMDLWDVKGLMERIIPGARLAGATLEEGVPEGKLVQAQEGFQLLGPGGAVLGFGGRIIPDKVDAPAWAGPVWGIELTLEPEPRDRPVPVFRPPPAFPGVDRDLALVLSKALPARQVETTIREAAGPLLVGLQVFDLYEGKGVPEGHRSVAFRLRFQSDERTLTDEDVDRAVETVRARLQEELGVETRG
jgi:phenylalanyl-tRNA synthetase beta chain